MLPIPTKVCFDWDLWCYDVAFAAQPRGGDLLPFSYCINLIDTRIHEICNKLGVKEFYGYLTGKGNFREQLAVSDVYKGNRSQPKPEYYRYIRDYLQNQYGAIVVDGMEADDAIAIDMTKDQGVICCSRDKDLRQVQGWHYGYSVGKQPEFELTYVDAIGALSIADKSSKLVGTGLKFFFSQVLTGDTTDNYKGAKGKGGRFAYNLLNELTDPDEMYDAVLSVYQEQYGLVDGTVKFQEQCRMAWMVRYMNEDGTPLIISGDKGFYYDKNGRSRVRPSVGDRKTYSEL